MIDVDAIKRRLQALVDRVREATIYKPLDDLDSSPGPSSSNSSSSRSSTDERHEYTELLNGFIPCPSCKGAGRIPKEMEERFVALIPLDDERLQPKKTWKVVALVVAICVLIVLIPVCFLIPRSTQITMSEQPIQYANVYGKNLSENDSFMLFSFEHNITIANRNFYPLNVLNASSTVISEFIPLNPLMVGFGKPYSLKNVSARSDEIITFHNTVNLNDVTAIYCQGEQSRRRNVFLNTRIEMILDVEVLGYREKLSYTTTRPVCCMASGDCTQPVIYH
ncbi:hypothetical protein L596_009112 [Steinernema carpocapsae]|uniref:Transmembrane protein 106 N-terminal domain-containing protein n=1 Tax=Steinernema carpocapsae TaxID=34508 RepID=A0A4U5PEP6_STECR|nr:hypothetical protein L596_009112 [Steinernema carpocapsae]